MVAAEPVSMLPSEASPTAEIYATTFYPSTIHDQEAARVSASAREDTPIRIELVRVRGARVSGSVVSTSGRPTAGMSVRLFRQFGGFGDESPVAAVSATGTFEIPRVAPGWYRLGIGSLNRETARLSARTR